MELTWDWLNHNNGAVVAVASIVGALVAAVYAILTGGLWWQTRQQARISRAMLEASQRPYLQVEPVFVEPTLGGLVEFHLHNHGSVPAVATWWKFVLFNGDTALVEQETEKPAALCVFPGQAMDPKPLILGPLLGLVVQRANADAVPLRVQATVKYRGLPNTRYETHIRGLIVRKAAGHRIVLEEQHIT